jgi:hypothetical protein
MPLLHVVFSLFIERTLQTVHKTQPSPSLFYTAGVPTNAALGARRRPTPAYPVEELEPCGLGLVPSLLTYVLACERNLVAAA